MEAWYQSLLLVFVAEMGDKTQILALVLSLRYKRPWPIMAGILVATLISHGLASYLGGYLSSLLSAALLRYVLAGVFGLFAVWALLPDKDDNEDSRQGRFGPFWATVGSYLVAEMGDKTQLATLALGARFPSPLGVTVGSTFGLLLADGLAVYFGESLTRRIPLLWIRRFAALMFAAFSLGILVGF